jgi:leader peptidase (prepilin peptidase)/N-methyltransferase
MEIDMNYLLYAVILIIVFFMGATVYSYLNVVISKLPAKEPLVEKRSVCPKCGHPQRIADVFPLVSWISRRGKCIYCQEKRPKRELVIELTGGFTAAALVCYYGLGFETITMFLFYAVLMVISAIDADTKEIPSLLNLIIIFISILSLFTIREISILDRLIGALCISIPMFIIAIIADGSIGGGDIKLMFSAGLLLGWRGMVFAFLLGMALAGIVSVYMLARKKITMKDSLALGPFLCIGLAVSSFGCVGDNIVTFCVNMCMSLFKG